MNHFPILILVGRPASGKSEIIDHLLHADPQERLRRFHIADPDVIDDFPMLWAWFEEDHLLAERLGKPRLHTDAGGYFLHEHLWHLLIARLDLEVHKRLREPGCADRRTVILEFSRGSEHGGYAAALPHLSDAVLGRAAVVYVRVSFAESLRKNRRRFNPNRPDSILEHGLPDEKLERLYGEDDWDALTAADPHFLHIRGLLVPYAVFENEDDVTTPRDSALADRLEAVLAEAWRLSR